MKTAAVAWANRKKQKIIIIKKPTKSTGTHSDSNERGGQRGFQTKNAPRVFYRYYINICTVAIDLFFEQKNSIENKKL